MLEKGVMVSWCYGIVYKQYGDMCKLQDSNPIEHSQSGCADLETNPETNPETNVDTVVDR